MNDFTRELIIMSITTLVVFIIVVIKEKFKK
jgi:hypothetical protein